MALSLSKSQQPQIVSKAVKIKLNNNYAIKACKSFKYLGLMVDNNLKFDIHVDYIKKKIQKKNWCHVQGK